MNRGLIEAPRPILDLVGGCVRLPRFMNRGLIEAPVPNEDGEPPSPLPRFMNRGLIEALAPAVRLDPGPKHFPDS